jgi:DNA-binding MarR family transcriptional regulator
MKIQEFTSKSFIFAIAHSYDVIWRKFNGKLKTHGCSITEALVLIAIFFEDPKYANPSAIAEALRTSRGNVSHCLGKLEVQKYVRRELSNQDSRRLSVSLTPAGTKLTHSLIAEIEQIEGYCESHFASRDQAAILTALFALGTPPLKNT